MKNPVELSQAQIDQFQKLYKDNYRPVQPLNTRTFLAASEPSPAQAPAHLPVTGGVPFEGGCSSRAWGC